MKFNLELPLGDGAWQEGACGGYGGYYYGLAYRNFANGGLQISQFDLPWRKPSKVPEDLIELADKAVADDLERWELKERCYTAAASAIRLCIREEHPRPQLEVVSNVIAVGTEAPVVKFKKTPFVSELEAGGFSARTTPHGSTEADFSGEERVLYLPRESFDAAAYKHDAILSNRGGNTIPTYVAQLGGEQVVVMPTPVPVG